MKLPELDISLAQKVTTMTTISTLISERIQSPTSNSINLISQIDLPLLPISEQQQEEEEEEEEATKNPTSVNLSLKHRKTTSISSLNSVISLNNNNTDKLKNKNSN